MDSASEFLLSKGDERQSVEDDIDGRAQVLRYSHRFSRKFCLVFLAIQALLLALYTIGSIVVIRRFSSQSQQRVQSLSSLVISYEPKSFLRLVESPFAGPPTAEIENSWTTLLENVNLRVSADELAPRSQSSIQLPEGGGYLAWLSVYHEIHCVKMLRQWFFRDHYFPNMTEMEESTRMVHTEHCLDLLLQTVMCNADTSLVTFKWDENEDRPLLNTLDNPHTCVDWDVFVDSVHDRVVSLDEMHRLQNPLLLS